MTTIHGFSVTSCRAVPELRATLHEYTHLRTGARLCWLERNDENMTFCIAFRTPAFDDTGVFHILEHSVLCGSERYPVKEPFVELMKGSVNTFLNALTYPDKTCYPVSSRNGQDFLNLTRVYLDAVFFPAIYKKEAIFQQEGHHIAFTGDAPSRQGVVLNEMRGAAADPDTIMLRALCEGLFPDTTYRFASGGDPASIPALTYASFLETHRRYYHPSNAFLMLDGAIDAEASFALLDEYLSRFDMLPIDTRIPLQKPVCAPLSKRFYALSEGEPLETRTKLGFGFVLGSFRDKKRLVAAQILADALCGSNEAPLCKAVLDLALAENVSLSTMEEEQQPWLLLEAENLRFEDCEAVRSALLDTLRALSETGLDHALIEASLTSLEFRMRERDYGTMPRGLVFIMDMLSSALYGGDPADRLEFGELFDDLRAEIGCGYFERLISELFLHNPHTAQTVLIPSATEAEARRRQESEELRAYLDGCTEEEKTALIEQERTLLASQQEPDSEQALASIPHIRLSDLPEEPAQLPCEVALDGENRILTHDVETDGIVYVSMYFQADDLTEQELPYAALLSALMCQLPTDTLTLLELQKQLRLQLGSLNVNLSAFNRVDGGADQIFMVCGTSMLREKLQDGAALAADVLRRTSFSDGQMILAVVRQLRETLQQQILGSGTSFALMRVMARIKPLGVFSELTRGVSFYRFLCALEQSFDERLPELQRILRELAERVFTASRLTLSVTGGQADVAEALLRILRCALPAGTAPEQRLVLRPWRAMDEGIVIPSDISFAAIGGEMPGAGYSGQLRIACRVASIGHLWNEVRVQNGAYGADMGIRDNGVLTAYSYRDPSAKTSLQAIRRTGGFLRDNASESLEPFIIGAISDAEPLLSPSLMGTVSDMWYFKGITPEYRQRLRRQMLRCTSEELIACAEQIDACMDHACVCVLGPEEQLAACADLTVEHLTK